MSEDKFAESQGMTLSQCISCIHLDDGKEWNCKAFPVGIPAEIQANEFDHRREHVGDHGVRFEPKAEVDPAYLARLAKSMSKAND